ncbi:MAG: glycosyltransferase, partial [Solirubrobacteraceae bacterium]
LGMVSDVELCRLYREAAFTIYPSLYEGFGFPVLEAMACGTPVVSFANSSLTEVVGDAGILVPDGDVNAMAAAVRSLLDDEVRWLEFSGRGLERVREFSWERSVDQHAQILTALAERG